MLQCRTSIFCLTVFLLGSLDGDFARAQATTGEPRITARSDVASQREASAVGAILVLKESFSSRDIIGMVRIDPHDVTEDMIALRTGSLTPELLYTAIHVLSTMRTAVADTATSTVDVYIRPTAVLLAVRRSRSESMTALVDRLRRAPRRSVRGASKVRVLRLPSLSTIMQTL